MRIERINLYLVSLSPEVQNIERHQVHDFGILGRFVVRGEDNKHQDGEFLNEDQWEVGITID